MILLIPPRSQPDPPPPAEARPSEVVVDAFGAEVRFFGVDQERIEWAQLREIALKVIDYGGVDGLRRQEDCLMGLDGHPHRRW